MAFSMRTAVAAVILLLVANAAQAATYYVAVTGSNANPCTSAAPCATLQRAADIVNPGDTVIVRDGVYTTTSDRFVDMNRAGTSNGWITFRSENKGGAKLDGRNLTDYAIVARPNVGAFVRFQDFDIYNFRHIGIVTSDAHDIQIVGNWIHDIGRRCSSVDEGYDAIYGRLSYNIRIEANVIYNIGRYGPGENGCTPTQPYWQNHDHGLYFDGGNGITVVGNMFHSFARGWGIHVYSGAGRTINWLRVERNTFYGPNPNREGQIVLASPTKDSTFVENVFYQPFVSGISTRSVTYTNVLVTRNIVYSGTIVDVTASGITLSGNVIR